MIFFSQVPGSMKLTQIFLLQRVRFREELENDYNIEDYKEQASTREEVKDEADAVSANNQGEENTEVLYKNEFERQLAEIHKQMDSIKQLPNLLQANLTALQEQLEKIIEAKAATEQITEETSGTSEARKEVRNRTHCITCF